MNAGLGISLYSNDERSALQFGHLKSASDLTSFIFFGFGMLLKYLLLELVIKMRRLLMTYETIMSCASAWKSAALD